MDLNKTFSVIIAVLLIGIILIGSLAFLLFSNGYLIKTDKKDSLSFELSVTDIDESNIPTSTLPSVFKSPSTEGTPLGVIYYHSIGHKDKITCEDNSDCDDSDIFTLDTCNLPGTEDSSCTNEEIICSENSDCGTDGFIEDVFCNGDDIWQNYRTFTCEVLGTGSCSQTTTPMLVTSCDNTCEDGVCISINCDNDSDCDDSDIFTLDTCNLPGTEDSYCTNENQQAVLTLMFSNTEYELKNNFVEEGVTYPQVHYYTHTRTFKESNNVGVTLNQGQICYEALNDCNEKGSVDYRIEANDELITEDKYFWTTEAPDKFTLTYWGVDDNGYNVAISQNMCTNEDTFTENC